MKQRITLAKELLGIKAGSEAFIENDFCYFGTNQFNLKISVEFAENNLDWFSVKEIYTPEDVEEGQYRQDEGGVYRILTPDGKNEYGIVYIEDHEALESKFSANYLYGDKLLSTPEISTALIKEAERRGYKIGQKVNRTYCELLPITTIGDVNPRNKYDSKLDRLYLGDTGIYDSGTWASIIEQPKEEKKEEELKQNFRELIDKMKVIIAKLEA